MPPYHVITLSPPPRSLHKISRSKSTKLNLKFKFDLRLNMSCALTYLEDIDIIGNSSSVHTVYKYGRLDHFCTCHCDGLWSVNTKICKPTFVSSQILQPPKNTDRFGKWSSRVDQRRWHTRWKKLFLPKKLMKIIVVAVVAVMVLMIALYKRKYWLFFFFISGDMCSVDIKQ